MEDSKGAMKKRMLAAPTIKKANLQGTSGGGGSSGNRVSPAHRPSALGNARDRPLPPALATAVRSSSSEMPMQMKVYNVINALREKDAPASEAEIMRLTAINLAASNELRELLKNNPKITYHPREGTYQYKPKYAIRSKEDLLKLLYDTRDQGGTEMKELIDSWAGLPQAVTELEKSGEIIVLTQNNRPRILFWNQKEYNVKMSPEFHEYWHKVQVPREADLAKELERAGLKSMEVFSTATKGDGALKTNKRRTNKRIKLTNTHLEGIDLGQS
ncbi:hypothetical protein BDZ88DRAFT_191283 [Geranomyces variabilis]|nr:hypothetical protein BDZ88DRAFT_191283 [Geranomyces variabilis]